MNIITPTIQWKETWMSVLKLNKIIGENSPKDWFEIQEDMDSIKNKLLKIQKRL